jgi:hypothetical protein
MVPLFLVVAILVAMAPAAAVGAGNAQGSAFPARVLFFASDGMRPDLMEQYAAEGAMPTYQQLMSSGVRGDNGVIQAFPPTTGVGWYTLATGTYPGEHGSTNTTYHRIGEGNFNNRTAAFSSGVLQADTLANAAERAGKKVAAVEWAGARNFVPSLAGPVIDFRNFFSTRGVLTYPLVASEQTGAAAFGISYQVASVSAASGWTNTPPGDDGVSLPQQAVLTVATTFAAQNPTRTYDVYFYDSLVDGVSAYDRVLLVRSGAGKNASQAAGNLAVGDWADVRLVGADGLIGARAGQTAGFYVKLTSLSGSAGSVTSFKLYFTSVTRAIASCACDPNFESTLVNMFPTSTGADFAPLEAGIIDEDTYVQQGLKWADFHWPALNYILTTVQPDTDLLFLGSPTTQNPSDFCPAYTPPPYLISRGQVLTALPFGTVVVTLDVSGAELKTMLENGVSRMPAVDGRFPQVSGLCFSYDISAPAGSRVTAAVRQAVDGSCTGAPIDLTAASTYKIAENDFMASGGGGYPVFTPRVTTQDIMDQVLADYIAPNTPITPAIQGRIVCTDGNGVVTEPNCPVVTP